MKSLKFIIILMVLSVSLDSNALERMPVESSQFTTLQDIPAVNVVSWIVPGKAVLVWNKDVQGSTALIPYAGASAYFGVSIYFVNPDSNKVEYYSITMVTSTVYPLPAGQTYGVAFSASGGVYAANNQTISTIRTMFNAAFQYGQVTYFVNFRDTALGGAFNVNAPVATLPSITNQINMSVVGFTNISGAGGAQTVLSQSMINILNDEEIDVLLRSRFPYAYLLTLTEWFETFLHEPVPPKIPIVIGTYVYEIDMTPYDGFATFFRWFLGVFFLICAATAGRNHFFQVTGNGDY